MKTKHLSDETLLLLSEGKLRGDPLLEALLHIETCDYCFERQPEQTAEEILRQLLTGDDEESDPKIDNPSE